LFGEKTRVIVIEEAMKAKKKIARKTLSAKQMKKVKGGRVTLDAAKFRVGASTPESIRR